MTPIGLNDRVKCVLTATGAEILNIDNGNLIEAFPKVETFARLPYYAAGDVYRCQFWVLFTFFGVRIGPGRERPFEKFEVDA